jgi:small multidrug resistance family-3 protein
MTVVKSLFYFLIAGLFEIGGGYLVWIWLRGGKSIWFGIAGAITLILYGVIPTLQPPVLVLVEYMLRMEEFS